MRKNIVAGNWKMNTTLPEGIKLAEEVNAALAAATPKCDVIICVPFTHLASINNVIDKNKLGLGAENCADHKSGAYTGEVSAPMVASTGANYVILGHSERRQYYGETSETLREKVRLALDNSLTPIFCIGEVLEERENGTFFDVVKAQIEEGLFNLSAEEFGKIILAYEPGDRHRQDRDRRPGSGDARFHPQDHRRQIRMRSCRQHLNPIWRQLQALQCKGTFRKTRR